ncbi:bifunctional DNA-formamidopyrimidine glycosylase/DNA-(apurinic or apyrimidinic site) lyase [Candidatus Latescibacterota bacterium]
MPELPEVETVRAAMERHLVGKSIASVWTSRKKLRQPLPRARLQGLVGDRFTAARRRAKFLLLEMLSDRVLLVHLGMTGNLIFRAERRKHDHLRLELEAGPPLVFADARRFGLVRVLSGDEVVDCPHLVHLGPEPLGSDFDADYLYEQCRGRQRPIKNLLLDGRVVVGVGNIYASESLFRAGIRPSLRAHRLSRARAADLVREIKAVLRHAIRLGGTTISDYMGSGSGGRFQQKLAVYGRTDESCLVCDAPVKAIVQAGRSTFYCPSCQK